MNKPCYPNYGPCRCCECRGIHCMLFHEGHSHRFKDIDLEWSVSFAKTIEKLKLEVDAKKKG